MRVSKLLIESLGMVMKSETEVRGQSVKTNGWSVKITPQNRVAYCTKKKNFSFNKEVSV